MLDHLLVGCWMMLDHLLVGCQYQHSGIKLASMYLVLLFTYVQDLGDGGAFATILDRWYFQKNGHKMARTT